MVHASGKEDRLLRVVSIVYIDKNVYAKINRIDAYTNLQASSTPVQSQAMQHLKQHMVLYISFP